LRPALAVATLTVAVVVAAFGALLITAIGLAPLPESGRPAAGVAAVPVAAITALADEEGCLAFAAKSEPEDHFVEIRHGCGQAGLDKGKLSVAG